MRAAIIGLATVCIAGNAYAADLLRGTVIEPVPVPGYQWSGFYIGGQVGYANVDYDFSTSTRGLVANMVRALLVEQEANISGLPNLPNRDARAASYGAFIGYNAQWGDVVLGLELNYNHTNLYAQSTDVIGRAFVTTNGFNNDVLITSTASARLTDYGTLRVRTGFAMGWVMPYAMAGFAVGQVNYVRSAHVQIIETNLNVNPPQPGGMLNEIASESRNNALTIGYSLGGGVDIGLTPNLFLRGEYEFMELAPVGGIGIRVNTIRAAAALKF
jgi:outer membrane immunogenic protein